MLIRIILVWIYAIYAECATVGFPNASSGDVLRLWNTVTKLVDDGDLLHELYFELVGANEESEELYGDASALERLILSLESSGKSDLASLLPLHYRSEPGFSNYSSGDTYFILNNKRFDRAEDLFYLKSADLRAQKSIHDNDVLFPEEKVVGLDADAPLVLFYGCDRAEEWESFNSILYTESSAGKIRFAWRSTCPNDLSFEFEPPALGLTVKDSQWGSTLNIPLDVPSEFASSDSSYKLQQVYGDSLRELDLKVATLISDFYQNNQDFTKTVEFTKQVINNFPVLAQTISETSTAVDEQWIKHLEKLEDEGIDHTMLGLFVNGQYLKLSDLDEWSLLEAVTTENTRMEHLQRILQNDHKITDQDSTILAQRLLNAFALRSLNTLQLNQPVRYDLHRIRGFSESVVYFNDIEKDEEYETLEADISEFFKESQFGEIPAYRENWNEVVFVIDLSDLQSKDTWEALQGLLRALDVIKKGYPQRIGFLPFCTKPQDMGLLRKIYELKSIGLEALTEHLKDLSPTEESTGSNFENLPPASFIIGSVLDINTTSIIINGEIYPFKSNLWNYLVAKVVKKDVSYIKDELRKSNDKNAKARSILHRRSFTARNKRYVPDYFEDATYSAVNISALSLLAGRTVEVEKDNGYNSVHTVTIVDDFSTKSGITRLVNLLQNELLGVRIRGIHSGVPGRHWDMIKRLVSDSDIVGLQKIINKSKDQPASNFIEAKILNLWLSDLSLQTPYGTSFLTLNGRVLHFEKNEIPSTTEFQSIIQREAIRTLDTLTCMEETIPNFDNGLFNADCVEMLSSILTKAFYDGRRIYNNGIDFTAETSISRINLNEILCFDQFGTFQLSHERRKVNVTLIIDPLEERTQKLLTLVSSLQQLSFVNVQVLLMPTKDLTIFPNHRLWLEGRTESLDLSDNFHVDVERPSYLHVENNAEYNFTVKHMVLEVNAFDGYETPSKSLVEGVGNVCLKLIDDSNAVIDETSTTGTFGYAQFKLRSLGRGLRIESCSEDYDIEGLSQNSKADFAAQTSFDVTTFSPIRIYLKLKKTDKRRSHAITKKGPLNLFSIVQSTKEEQQFRRLVATMLRSKNHPQIKFWILPGEPLSLNFQSFLQFMSEQSSGAISFEFMTYHWPRWLRPQRFRARELAAVKVMMLDLIFPPNVSKVIYLSPNAQVTNISEFENFNFDSVYSFPRASHIYGDPYWKHGYWKNFLSKNNLKFHSIEPAFIVNLAKYREVHAGDKLRIHYQRLSQGIHFLENLDQDLVNDMQPTLPISTLDRKILRRDPASRLLDENFFESMVHSFEAINGKTSPTSATDSGLIDHDEL